jgi:hypothetical protein
MSRQRPGTAQMPVRRLTGRPRPGIPGATRHVRQSGQGGYLTPSLKARRNVVTKDFAADIDALHS